MYSVETYPVDHTFWELLAYCAGTGGSILIIGSAAGVAIMGTLKINFIWYLRKISLLALAGYLAGKRSVQNGVKKAVLDVGRADTIPGGRIFASLKGLVDGGMEIPHSDSIFPSDERIKGAHISEKINKQVEKIMKGIEGEVK